MRRSAATLAIFVAAVSLTSAAENSIDASMYPAAALKTADTLIPELSSSLRTCDVEQARLVHERAHEFIYKEWGWVENYKSLKPYRACFQMLRDIAETTRLVTNRYSTVLPHAVAGPFDVNYAACRKLADPSYDLRGAAINSHWPERFGSDPSGKLCSR